jgi:hypothetical protein
MRFDRQLVRQVVASVWRAARRASEAMELNAALLLSTVLAPVQDSQVLGQLTDHKTILVVRLDVIGDFVLMSPFLRELRRNAPEAHITLH